MGKRKQSEYSQVKHLGRFLLPVIVLCLTSVYVQAVGAPYAKLARSTATVDSKQVIPVSLDNSRHKSNDELAATGTTLPWNIHFWAVPVGDDSLHIFTGQTTEMDTTVNAEVGVGGAPRRRFVMTYNIDESAYEAVAADILIPSSSTVEGDIGLSTDLDTGDTFHTGWIDFRRFFVPTTGAPPIVSDDNLLEMTIGDSSLTAPVYVAVMSANAIPGPLPWGHQLVGQPYSVRPSGAIVTSTQPMLLKLFYTDTTLGDVDPHTLSVLQWEPVAREWDDLGGSLDDAIEHSVSTTTDRFTVYALMSTPRWRDGFNDFTGLSEWDGVTVLLPNGELVLNGLVYTGTATSRTITPTVAIEEWGHMTFTSTATTGTSLTVDVLSADGIPLISDVTSGASLASIDPITYPSLKLRATFSTNNPANSASLDEWAIVWQPRVHQVYLPAVLRQ